MQRITTFIGAGATIDLGAYNTEKITKEIIKKKQEFIDRKEFYIRKVARQLTKHYNATINFEDIFHALETINSFQIGWKANTDKKYKPCMTGFTKPLSKKLFTDDIILRRAIRDLIVTVTDIVNKYNNYYYNISNDWHKQFWIKAIARTKWDLCTLNYDTVMEQTLKVYEDGYRKTQYNFDRFEPKKIYNTKKNRIMHLHGCINYGYARTENINEYTLEDDFQDLYKYYDYNLAKQTWFERSKYVSQSSEYSIIGPIITGQRKTDKVVAAPYNYYYTNFNNAITNNEALLILGYSFGDYHFNRMLERIYKIHKDKRRIVIIDKIPYFKEAWRRDWAVSHEKLSFIKKAFNESDPINRVKYTKPFISKDGRARIYAEGYKDALINHGDEIIDFLLSTG